MVALVPMASMPAAMSGRNGMTRRLIVDSIRNDPERKGGDYTTQPSSLRFASLLYGIATNGDLTQLKAVPMRAGPRASRRAAEGALRQRRERPPVNQWDASRDYDPSPLLGKIDAHVLAINSTDVEQNRPEVGTMERELNKVHNARMPKVQGGPDTAGHGTTAKARLWKAAFDSWVRQVPRGPR